MIPALICHIWPRAKKWLFLNFRMMIAVEEISDDFVIFWMMALFKAWAILYRRGYIHNTLWNVWRDMLYWLMTAAVVAYIASHLWCASSNFYAIKMPRAHALVVLPPRLLPNDIDDFADYLPMACINAHCRHYRDLAILKSMRNFNFDTRQQLYDFSFTSY